MPRGLTVTPLIFITNDVNYLQESSPDFFSNDMIKQAENTLLNLTLMEMLNPPKYEHNLKALEELCSWPIIIISGPPKSGKGTYNWI